MKDIISGKKLLETLPWIKVIICTQFDFFDRKLVQRCPKKCFTHQLTTKGKLFQMQLNNMVQYSQTWGRKARIHLQNSRHALRKSFCMLSQMLKMKSNVTIQMSKYVSLIHLIVKELETKRMLGSVVAVAFQIIFLCWNICQWFFFIFKKSFLTSSHQNDPKRTNHIKF
jgi:hypothetical protein